MAKNPDAVWTTIDETTLSAASIKAIGAFKESAKVTANLRAQAQAAVSEEILEAIEVPDGHEIQVGFNFGRVAFAVVPKAAEKAPKGAFKLPGKKPAAKADKASVAFKLKQ